MAYALRKGPVKTVTDLSLLKLNNNNGDVSNWRLVYTSMPDSTSVAPLTYLNITNKQAEAAVDSITVTNVLNAGSSTVGTATVVITPDPAPVTCTGAGGALTYVFLCDATGGASTNANVVLLVDTVNSTVATSSSYVPAAFTYTHTYPALGL